MPTPPLELAIPNYSTTTPTDSKPYTLYQISIRQPLRSYTVQKRYSDFLTLHATLETLTSSTPPAPLPPKTWLKSTTTSPELAESRRADLERYLCAINEAADSRWRDSAAFKTFLNLPTSSGKNGGNSTTSGRLSNATISDPNVWSDVHRDLKSQLRAARQAVTRRDASAEPKEQHESAAEAKGCLIRAGGMMAVLGDALKSMSESTNSASGERTAGKLGEGEIRRRKDLLASATKERDSIQEALSAQVARMQQTVDGANGSTPSRDALLSPGKPRIKSGRTLGAAKETEETQPLDNEGVAQLQVQKMRDQDQDVEVLSAAVQRMKEMGVQINNELELQNEMIGVLDNDAERLQKKIDVGRKRADKIK